MRLEYIESRKYFMREKQKENSIKLYYYYLLILLNIIILIIFVFNIDKFIYYFI